MAGKSKITTGPNDRPVDETIAQTGPGLPDDNSSPPEANERQIERVRRSLMGRGEKQAGMRQNRDAVPENTPGAGENVCRRCAGSGMVDDEACPECGGSGKVTTPVGGA